MLPDSHRPMAATIERDQQTEQYGRHRGLGGREIHICRAEVLGDRQPSDEGHRQHTRGRVTRLRGRLHVRGTHPDEAQCNGRHQGPDGRFERYEIFGDLRCHGATPILTVALAVTTIVVAIG